MIDDLKNRENEYFEFDDSFSCGKLNIFCFFKKENFTFFLPLFVKLPKKETIYWSFFSVVALCFTGAILHFIDSYAQDMDKYETSMTSVGKYHAIYEDMNDNVVYTDAKNQKSALNSSP